MILSTTHTRRSYSVCDTVYGQHERGHTGCVIQSLAHTRMAYWLRDAIYGPKITHLNLFPTRRTAFDFSGKTFSQLLIVIIMAADAIQFVYQ